MVDLVNVAKAFESIQSTEEKWLYVLRSAHKASSELEVDDEDIADALKRIRVDSADDELLKRQASDMVTQDEIDCRIAEAILDGRELGEEIGKRLGMELGKEIGLAEGMAEGRAKGMAEGREKGMAEGRAKGMAEGHEKGMVEGLAEGKAVGLAEGRAEGLAEGRAEGRKEGCREIAGKMLLGGFSVEQVVNLTELPEPDVLAVKRELKL